MAFCVAPMFARVGVVKVDVSVDGGRTYLPGIDYKLGKNVDYCKYTCASFISGRHPNVLLD